MCPLCSVTIQLYGVTEQGQSVLVRAGGVMPYVMFARPSSCPDAAWDKIVDFVREHICKRLDSRCVIERVKRKDLFGLHYNQVLDFACVKLSSIEAHSATLKFLQKPLQDARVSAHSLGPLSVISRSGLSLSIFEVPVNTVCVHVRVCAFDFACVRACVRYKYNLAYNL